MVATSYQIIFKEKKLKVEKVSPFLALIAPVLFLTYFLNLLKINVMDYVVLSLIFGSLINFIFLDKNIIKKVILSAVINTAFYSICYLITWHSFPELPASYQFQNLSGILLGGIPIEEFLWIFSFSLYWMPVYEIWRNYFKKIKK